MVMEHRDTGLECKGLRLGSYRTGILELYSIES